MPLVKRIFVAVTLGGKPVGLGDLGLREERSEAPMQKTVPYSSRRAYLVWAAATAAYVVAVVHRTSLGVTGLEAADRFGTTASQLALFTVVQLVVYAGAQIPVGVLLDRYGARMLISVGAVMMAVGQLGMAFADSIPLALCARVLIGAGDATTFVSVLRLIAAWFSPRKAPLLSQITGQIAQTGQIISAVPFVIYLHATSWSSAFSLLGACGVAAAIWVVLFVRNQPHGQDFGATGKKPRPIDLVPEDGKKSLHGALSTPGSWLGFWTHFVTAFSFNVFVFLWGKPFLVLGQGLSSSEVSLVFTAITITAMVSGLLIGVFCSKHPLRRSWLVYAVVFAITCGWLGLLIPSGPSPFWFVVLCTVVIAIGGPASLIGLDFARTSNPASRLGAGSGVANMGGFVGGFLSIMAIGVLLDVIRPSGDYVLNDFRIAFSFMLLPLLVGLAGVAVTKRRTRFEYAARGITVPPVREAWQNLKKK